MKEAEYQEFWVTNNGVLFQDANWLSLVTAPNEKVEYYGYYANGVFEDAFAIIKMKGRLLKSYTVPSFTPWLGWINESIDPNLIIQFLKKQNPDVIYYATKQKTSGWDIGTTYMIDLSLSFEELLANVRQDKKRNIKKAQTQQLKLSFTKDFKILQNLVQHTYKRQDKQFNGYSQLQKITESYPNTFQITVSDEQNTLASLLFAYDRETVYYLIGGFDHQANNYNAGPYAMWKGIEHAKKLNMITFDFEGSEIPSIAQYFESFGGVKKEYYSISQSGFIYSLVKKIK